MVIDSLINERYPLRLTPDRHEFHAARPKWEAERLASCAERIQPGMTVYDVGAESGDFSALYKSWVGPEGRVVLVEPQPAYWPQIRAHFEGNDLGVPDLSFVGFASDRDHRPLTRVFPIADGWWPLESIGTVQPDYGFCHLAQQADTIPQLRLDTLAEVTGLVPDVIVMDIEGAEYHALIGCARLCNRSSAARPLLYVSVHEPTMLDWYGKTLDDLLALVASYGYGGTLLGTNGEDYWLFEPWGGD